jgi:signal transduction histidine kinase/CheY-like chemotaxis protein
VRWLSGRARPVRDADGHLARYVGIITDITDRRALEGQLEQSQKLESVGRLAGGLAHDFNNLLTVVTSASELLHDEPLSDEASSLLGEIDDAGRRGAALTRQLLSFSRQDILEPIVVELGGLVEEALRLLRRLIGENVQLTHTRRDAVRVRVDAGQWDQVLVNLVVNARDAMPKGGTLRVETGGIVLGGIDARFPDAAPGPYALLRVADSGEGMTPEVRARIFEPFFTTKPRQQGTGLGLAVVYGIVKQAGGHIHVDSEPGRGTTFSILVPLSERPADAPTTASARQRALGGGPETILLVEDDDAVRRVASRSLSQRGYEVLTAPDGEAALAVLERRSVDLVVTDVVMPNLDGPSLVRVVRTRWPRIKVLLSTGYIDGSLEMHELADHPVLRKPYSQQKLLEKVCEVLRG